MKTLLVTRGAAEFTAGAMLGGAAVAVSAWAPWQVAAVAKAAASAERRLTEEVSTLAGVREPEHVENACVCSVRASAQSPRTTTMMCDGTRRMLLMLAEALSSRGWSISSMRLVPSHIIV